MFDLDDTLYPERDFVLSGFRAVGDWLVARYGLRGFSESASRLFEEGRRGTIFDETLARLDYRHDPVLIRSLVAVYREHLPLIALHEDACWALEHFPQRTRTGILTDGFLVTQQRKVDALKIGASVGTIVYSDAYGRDCWKPSKVPYLKMMEAFDCAGADCVYVADNPTKDFVSAKSLGWRTVRIRRRDGEYHDVEVDPDREAHHQISTLYDLKELV